MELSPDTKKMLADRLERRFQSYVDQARSLGFEATVSKRGVTLFYRGKPLGTARKPAGWGQLLGKGHAAKARLPYECAKCGEPRSEHGCGTYFEGERTLLCTTFVPKNEEELGG